MKPLAAAMLIVIVGLGVASYVLIGGLVRQVREASVSLLQISQIATADDEPLDPTGEGRRFEVARGESAASIAERLEHEGLIKSALAFRVRARSEGVDVRFEAGEFELSPAMRPSEIMVRLQRGRLAGRKLTIPEGWRVAQIADAMEAQQAGARAAFLLATTTVRVESPLLSARPSGASLEGYLFPDTYEIDAQTPPTRVVETMLRTFTERVTPDLVSRARERGLTTHQLVTLASIVEREARIPTERATIAGVFLNRLRQDMPLQADATVQYALWTSNDQPPDGIYWKRALTAADLRLDSPYNTYTRKGLPPGPICSPGLAALQAVVDSPPTDLLYFVARPDGSHAFSRTLADHNANVARINGGGR